MNKKLVSIVAIVAVLFGAFGSPFAVAGSKVNIRPLPTPKPVKRAPSGCMVEYDNKAKNKGCLRFYID